MISPFALGYLFACSIFPAQSFPEKNNLTVGVGSRVAEANRAVARHAAQEAGVRLGRVRGARRSLLMS
jgi:hypothetical protein